MGFKSVLKPLFLRVLFYGGLLFCLYLVGTNLLFFPFPYEDENTKCWEDVYFMSGKAVVHGRYIEAKCGKPTIIFSHGNGGNVANYFPIVYDINKMTGCGVLIYDYRGYGKSKGFSCEKNTYEDLRSAVKFVREDKGKPDIILWGVSIGGAVTAQIATEQTFRAVILQNTFSNIRDMAEYKILEVFFRKTNNTNIKKAIHWLVYHLPCLQPFDTKNKVGKIKSPLLIMSSAKDTLIPVEMAYVNAENNKNAKLIVKDFGDHNDFYTSLDTIAEYINHL